MGDQGSAFEWRRKRDRLDKAIERVEHAPWTLLNRGLITIPQKRKLYEVKVTQSFGFGYEAEALRVGYARRGSDRDVAIDWG
jgi:hypothetical protein